ncbi:MAG: hypothetical protein HDT43_12665 [Ruminococcaceae bacterium]|nr:hypothetical protein [Oscillospiraceae bacterium]
MDETIVLKKAAKPLNIDALIMTAVYIAALTLHILITGAATIFNLTPDEYSVTAIAAYLNGLDWSPTVSMGGYYGYFQGLFYVPVFWVTDDPYMRYRLMLVINGVLMSFIPVIAYRLSRGFEVKRPAAAVFSLICGMYPSYMLLTKFTWNETMCCLLPWVFLLLLYSAYDCTSAIKKQALSVLGGLTLAAAYATHGRMLSLVAAGIVLELVVFFTMKKKLFCFSGFFGGTFVGLFADRALKKFFQGALWNVGDGKSAPINTIEKMMSRLFGENGTFSIAKFFQTLIGHFFYFFSSTWGFGAVCVVMIIVAIVMYYRRRNRTPVTLENGDTDAKTLPYIGDKTAVFCWFSLLLMGAAFAVSVLFKSTSTLFDKRMDTTIYGRYTEAFYPVAILCALVLIYKGKLSRWQSIAAFGLNAVAAALTQLFTVPIVTNSETFVSAMVLGLAPMRYGEGLKALYTQTTFLKIFATVLGVSILWTIAGLIKRFNKFRWAAFCVPLAGVLIYSGIYGYIKYNVPQAKNAKRSADIMTAAVDKLDGRFDEITLFAVARDRYVKTQFLYPETTVKVASTVSAYRKLESKPEIVLANIEETPELWFDELRLVGSLGNAVHIYAASESACEWAIDKGYRLGESGAVTYTPAELKTNSSAVKTNYDEYADLDYAGEGENVTLTLPNGAAAYTNYTHLQKGTYTFTVYGEGIISGTVKLYADKGDTALPVEITSYTDGELCAEVTLDKKTENVRFTFKNTSAEPTKVEKLIIRKVS